MKKELLEWAKALVIAVAVYFVISFFFGTITVISTSMLPTLEEGDMLILSKIGGYEQGDIVSFQSELSINEQDIARMNPIQKLVTKVGDKKNLIKRIIAVPGDKIVIKDGVVMVNDAVIDEPYINTMTNGDISIDEIPEGKYFCMGDNRQVSKDSRDPGVGLIDESSISGKAIFRVLPFNRISSLK